MKRHIVIISDSFILAFMTRPMLEGSEISIAAFERSAEGLEACRANPPDLVILQYSSTAPPPDAFRIARSIRQDSHTSTVPILMICPVEQAARASGATAWMDIVFEPSTLRDHIQSLLHVERS